MPLSHLPAFLTSLFAALACWPAGWTGAPPPAFPRCSSASSSPTAAAPSPPGSAPAASRQVPAARAAEQQAGDGGEEDEHGDDPFQHGRTSDGWILRTGRVVPRHVGLLGEDQERLDSPLHW